MPSKNVFIESAIKNYISSHKEMRGDFISLEAMRKCALSCECTVNHVLDFVINGHITFGKKEECVW